MYSLGGARRQAGGDVLPRGVGQWWHIVIAAIGFGAAGEAIRRYRMFKAKRRARPIAVRNAGFWTDLRLLEAEVVVTSSALGAAWTPIILAVNTNRVIEWTYVSVVLFPIGVYLILYGLNAPPRRQ